MAETRSEKSPHQEIAELERMLVEKKQALAQEGRVMEEKEAFREVFRERHGKTLAPQTPVTVQPQPALKPDELAQQAEALKAKEREEQLEDLIALAFSKGVRAAADLARHATPWLMDELHDRLQDKYYEHLIQAKRLKAL